MTANHDARDGRDGRDGRDLSDKSRISLSVKVMLSILGSVIFATAVAVGYHLTTLGQIHISLDALAADIKAMRKQNEWFQQSSWSLREQELWSHQLETQNKTVQQRALTDGLVVPDPTTVHTLARGTATAAAPAPPAP
jgi:cell division protein FtsB